MYMMVAACVGLYCRRDALLHTTHTPCFLGRIRNFVTPGNKSGITHWSDSPPPLTIEHSATPELGLSWDSITEEYPKLAPHFVSEDLCMLLTGILSSNHRNTHAMQYSPSKSRHRASSAAPFSARPCHRPAPAPDPDAVTCPERPYPSPLPCASPDSWLRRARPRRR